MASDRRKEMKAVGVTMGALVSAVVLLVVAVPILDGLTITHIDPVGEGQDRIYYAKVDPEKIQKVMFTEDSTFKGIKIIPVNGTVPEEYYAIPDWADMKDIVLGFNDDKAIIWKEYGTVDLSGGAYAAICDANIETETAYVFSGAVVYQTKPIVIQYTNGNWAYEGMYSQIATNFGPDLYIATNNADIASYIGAESATISKNNIAKVYHLARAPDASIRSSDTNSIVVSSYIVNYDSPGGTISGTSNIDNRGINADCMIYKSWSRSVTSAEMTYTVIKDPKNNDRATVAPESMTAVSTSRSNPLNVTCTGSTSGVTVIVDANQDIVSEYRDIAMILPVIMAVGLMAGIAYNLIPKRRNDQ